MGKFKDSWRQQLWYEKAAFFVGVPCAAAVIILGVLQIVNALETPVLYSIPLMCVMMLSQAVQQWRQNRGTAVFSLCTAGFLAALAVCAFILLC